MSQLSRSIFVGPMKAGTSWIDEYLRTSGEIILPSSVKETFFFDRHFDKGVEWYDSHFLATDKKGHIVEVAPSYFSNIDVPTRIHARYSSVNIIVTLRNPISRAWSHYLHLRRYGYTSEPIYDAVNRFPQILRSSRYNECLSRWCQLFGKENVKVLWQEDMIKDIDQYSRVLCSFLEISHMAIPARLQGRSNEAAVAPSSKLAALGRSVSYSLRDRRMYGVVNAAKMLGLKNIFFGKPGRKPVPKISADEEIWLREQLRSDFDSLPEEYRHPSVMEI